MSSVDIAMPTGLASDVVLGALFFDVPALHQEGWLCVAGREPVRVAGTYQIPDNYAVITNLDFDQHRLAGLALGHDVPRPGASWRRLLPREIPKLEADIPRWISRRRPMLVQVVVRETHSALHRLINPGADLRREQSQRLWRTSDEILMLSFFSELRILDAWEVDETLCFIKESDGLGKALALSDEAQEAAEVSVSYGWPAPIG